jgi:hypothetical protein
MRRRRTLGGAAGNEDATLGLEVIDSLPDHDLCSVTGNIRTAKGFSRN